MFTKRIYIWARLSKRQPSLYKRRCRTKYISPPQKPYRIHNKFLTKEPSHWSISPTLEKKEQIKYAFSLDLEKKNIIIIILYCYKYVKCYTNIM